ncbi:MAG: response regulator transcription factor [Epsilonproteobacteria bacterium]|nr:response regulator transcription factor [Campylobacterota bacterium]
MRPLIVIIEDDKDLLELLEYRLDKEGYEVVGFLSTKKVEDFLLEEEPSLLIVDRNLPGVEGSEFVKDMRQKGHQAPVIFLSAKDSDRDIEEGFLRGGDDYITKPYNMIELILRVKAILRRTKSADSGKVAYKDIVLDLDTREVFVDKKKIKLSKLEFNLLYFFLEHKNVVLKRDEILENVWRDKDFKQDKTLNVAINRLKKKIELHQDDYITATRGVGYKFC